MVLSSCVQTLYVCTVLASIFICITLHNHNTYKYGSKDCLHTRRQRHKRLVGTMDKQGVSDYQSKQTKHNTNNNDKTNINMWVLNTLQIAEKT
jgi:hypothetical protein